MAKCGTEANPTAWAISAMLRRKLRAYHCFMQAGVVAQGLLTVIGILLPDYCWSKQWRKAA